MTAIAGSALADIRLKPMRCPFPASAAFLIEGAKGELDGVASEYQWLAANRPGWSRDAQALMNKNGRYFDLLMISRGQQKTAICFDITEFFGKHPSPASPGVRI